MSNLIKYRVAVENLYLSEEWELELPFQYLKRTILGPSDEAGKIPIRFELGSEVDDVESVKSLTLGFLGEILDGIASEFGGYIGRPFIEKMTISNRSYASRPFSCSVCVVTPYEDVNKLKETLESRVPFSNRHLRLYRNCLQIPGAVARFMFFYSILLDLQGPSQKNVDDYIRRKRPSTKNMRSTKGNFMETEYTYYRNQMGHTQNDADIPFVEQEIIRLEPDFGLLVRDAIFEQLASR